MRLRNLLNGRNKSSPGLTALGFEPTGISVTRVVRAPERRADARAVTGPERTPMIEACDFYPYSDHDDVGALLRQVGHEHDLGRSRCTTLLNNEGYKLLMTDAPEVEESELRSAVRWRIKDLIDLPLDDITLDVFHIPDNAQGERTHHVYVVAASNEAIRHRVDLITGAGINLQVIDIPELAQRNIASLLPDDQEGVALLWFQPQEGLITLTREGTLHLSRHFTVGYDHLGDESGRQTAEDSVILEVQRSLDYLESHFRQLPIRKLVLAPLPIEVPGLASRLSGALGIEVSALDMGDLLTCKTGMPSGWQARHFIALGAALRHEGPAA